MDRKFKQALTYFIVVAPMVIAMLSLGIAAIWRVSELMIDAEQKSARCSTIFGAKYGGGKCFKDGKEV